MISGPAKALLWIALAAAPTAAPAASADSRDLDTLLAALARDPPQSIPFAEFHASRLLKEELVVTGTLEYAGTGKLARVVTAPYQERTDIDGDLVRIERADRPARRFSLARAPELGGLLLGISALLSGDRAALEREFGVVQRAAGDAWQLELTPRQATAGVVASTLRVRGAADAPRCLTVLRDGRVASELLFGEAATAADLAGSRASHCGTLP